MAASGGPEGLVIERMYSFLYSEGRTCTFGKELIDRFALSYDTQDGLFDLAWSEINENQVVTSSGDGSIKMWDATLVVSFFSLVNYMQ